MAIYQLIVFLQGEDADEALRILNEDGTDAAIEFLSQWDNGDALESEDEPASGDSDDVYEDGHYRLSWNHMLNYIGLEYVDHGIQPA